MATRTADAIIGVACGLAGAAALTRLLGSLLFDVSPLDPLTYAGVSLGLTASAIMASYVPALAPPVSIQSKRCGRNSGD